MSSRSVPAALGAPAPAAAKRPAKEYLKTALAPSNTPGTGTVLEKAPFALMGTVGMTMGIGPGNEPEGVHPRAGPATGTDTFSSFEPPGATKNEKAP